MTRYADGPVTVTVPATSANLGPGFDCLGLALTMYDEVTAEILGGPDARGGVGRPPQISVEGEGAGTVPLDAGHLVHCAMARGFEAMGLPLPVVRLHCRNDIPHGRGLGSSSAAIVAGLAVARGLVHDGGSLLDDGALFVLAAEMEGHPDNVAPAVHGGFTVAYDSPHGARAVTLEVDHRVRPVAFVPPEPLETKVARALLPASVPHRDAAANAGRAALLVAALTGRPELLLEATEDRLHQSYRAAAMPDSIALLRALREREVPAVVSGAGPTVLALLPPGGGVRSSSLVTATPPGWHVRPLDVERTGVRSTRA